MNPIGYYYTLVTILALMMYGADKMAARAGGWRIPERTLFAISLFGGCIGAIAGMLIFRHKTRKPKFWIVNFAASLIHAAILYLLVMR